MTDDATMRTRCAHSLSARHARSTEGVSDSCKKYRKVRLRLTRDDDHQIFDVVDIVQEVGRHLLEVFNGELAGRKYVENVGLQKFRSFSSGRKSQRCKSAC